jgi:hypothetical protein
MTWSEFVARVEEQSQLDHSARILDIDVVQPCLDKELDLCVLVGRRHRTFRDRLLISEPNWTKGGYLMVWRDRGRDRHRGSGGFNFVEKPKSTVLTEDAANKGVKWVELRSVIENHPDYKPYMWVNTVDIDACPADQITLEVSKDWYEPSLIIRGEPKPEPSPRERLIETMRNAQPRIFEQKKVSDISTPRSLSC